MFGKHYIAASEGGERKTLKQKYAFLLLYNEVQKNILPTFTFPWGFIYLTLPLAH